MLSFFRISLDIQTNVYFFQMNFRIILSSSFCKIGIALNLQINMRWFDVFTIFSLPMQKRSMPLHLFCSSFISPIKFCSCLYIGHTHFSLSLFLSIFPLLLGMASLFHYSFWRTMARIKEIIDWGK